MAASPIALDHNFPEPILQAVAPWLPEFAFHWVKDLPPGDLNELEDHDLVYELHRRRFPVMVTNNHKMFDDPRVLVAIAQTRLTVVGLAGAGDDPIFSTGVLLRDLRDVLRANVPQGMFVRVRPARVRLDRARQRLVERLGLDWDQAEQELGRPYAERTEYPAGHEYRVRSRRSPRSRAADGASPEMAWTTAPPTDGPEPEDTEPVGAEEWDASQVLGNPDGIRDTFPDLETSGRCRPRGVVRAGHPDLKRRRGHVGDPGRLGPESSYVRWVGRCDG